MLVCAELEYTNSQIWFIRFDVEQTSRLVCVGNQAGEVFVWMLSGKEFVQVLFVVARENARVVTHDSQVGHCSSKKYPACVRQTALAATGVIVERAGCFPACFGNSHVDCRAYCGCDRRRSPHAVLACGQWRRHQCGR